MLKKMSTAIILFILFYLAACFCIPLIEPYHIFQPGTDGYAPPADKRFAEVAVTTSDGLAHTYWYAKGKAGAPAVLYLHGNGGPNAFYAPRLLPYLDAGCAVLMVEYRGYGGAPGSPSEDGIFYDAQAGLEFLQKQGHPHIVMHGFSLGTAVATRLAAAVPPQALIIEAGFSSIAEVGGSTFPFNLLPLKWFMRNTFDTLKYLPQLESVPLLQFHGGQDRLVPPPLGRKYFEHYPGTGKRLVFLDDADHNSLPEHGMFDHIFAWKYFYPASASGKD